MLADGLAACRLTEAGLPAICIETRQAKTAHRVNHGDRLVSRAHVKSPPCRSRRALLTALRIVLNKRRDVENGIRAMLPEVRLKVGTPSRKDFPARVRELTGDEPVLARLAASLLSMVEVMTKEVERLTKRAIDEVKTEPTCRRLMTVPGVGPLTGLTFRATIDQPDCFRKSRDVGTHLGLAPRRYQSGDASPS